MKFKHVTKRDYSIVEWVYHARYATKDIVRDAIFAPTTDSSCKTRLQVLRWKGFLKTRPRTDTRYPFIYYLGLRGRRYIADKYKISREQVDKVAGVNSTQEHHDLFMEHDLALASIYAHATGQSQAHRLTMEWKNARMLELENLGVQPDAWIRLSRDGKTRQAYIELTRVLPTKDEWEKKISAYFQLVIATTIPILWFTTSKAKAEAIREAVRGSDISENILIGLEENKNDFINGEVWTASSGSQKVRWINLGGVGVATPSPTRTTLSPFPSVEGLEQSVRQPQGNLRRSRSPRK